MDNKRKIIISDYCGHPFQLQLSQNLAKSGYDVIHIYCPSFSSPHGKFEELYGLRILPVPLKNKVNKTKLHKRILQDIEFGKLVADIINTEKPDVVIASNTPLFALSYFIRSTHKVDAKFIFWLQDIHSIAFKKIISHKIPIVGGIISGYLSFLEKKYLANSDHIVSIADDFKNLLSEWGINIQKVSFIPNWSPIEEIPLKEKNNPWSKEKGLNNKLVFLYSGTLGFKHNPDLLLELSKKYSNVDDIVIVVISEGQGEVYLKEKIKELGLKNLLILPFQDFDQMPNILATSDVLIALLEPDAGIFSVPSKVLTYLCSGRPILLSVPDENLSSRIVSSNNAGETSNPLDSKDFLEKAETLISNKPLRQKLGENGRLYAENNFKIENIKEKFIAIIRSSI